MANLIQIKRSLTTSSPPSLANGELAYTANGDVLYIGSNGNVVAIGGKRYPGVLTVNQALVANSSGYIDYVKTANAWITTLYANGSIGSSGQVLVSNGSGIYWGTGTTGSNTQVQFNDSGVANATAGFTFDKSTNNLFVANSISTTTLFGNVSGTYATLSGQVNTGTLYVTTSANVGTYFTVNSSSANINVNTSLGGALLTLNSNVVFNANVTTNGALTTLGGTNTYITSNITVSGTNATVNANTTFNSNVSTAGALTTLGGTNTYITSNSTISGTNTVINANSIINGSISTFNANTTFNSNVSTAGALTTLGGTNTYITSNTTIAGTNTVINSNTFLNANISVSGALTTLGGTNTYITSNTTIGGTNLNVNANNTLGGTTTTINSNSTINGTTTIINSNLVANATSLTINSNTNFSGRVASNFLPTVSNSYDLGSSGYKWRTGYFGTAIELGSTTLADNSGALAVNNLIVYTDATIANIVGTMTNISSNVNITSGHIYANDASLSIQSANVSGALYVGTDLYVGGNVVSTNVSTLNITDPFINLATDNETDSTDSGILIHYANTPGLHAGFFRHAATDEFYIFEQWPHEILGTTIDIANNDFKLSTLNTYLHSAGLVSNATNIAIAANSTLNVAITANTLSLSSPLSGTSGGTGLNSYTNQDILVANATNGFNKLGLGTDGYVLQSNGSALIYASLDGGTF